MPKALTVPRRSLVRLGLALTLAALAWELWRWAGQGFTFHIDDFVEYWAAGRLFLSGGNPYDPPSLLRVQRSVGWTDPQPLMMWNPPWTLALVIPFSLLPYTLGRIAWFISQTGFLLLSGGLLWRIYQPHDRRVWPGLVLSMIFVPSLFAIRMGQIAPFLLAGWVGFLWFQRQRRDVLAGACLALPAAKPHLLYLFWILLLLWVWQNRRWKILAGLAATLMLTTGLLMARSPALPAQYLATFTQEPPLYWATPTIGAILRLIFGIDRSWLQFLPPALGALLGLFLMRRWGSGWTWEDRGPLILLLSVSTAAFGWSLDQPILLPAIILSFARAWRTPQSRTIWLVAFGVVEILALSFNLLSISDIWYVWLAPAWLCVYLLPTRVAPHPEPSSPHT